MSHSFVAASVVLFVVFSSSLQNKSHHLPDCPLRCSDCKIYSWVVNIAAAVDKGPQSSPVRIVPQSASAQILPQNKGTNSSNQNHLANRQVLVNTKC